MNLSTRLFGAFFYYPPTSEALKPLYTSLNEIESLFLWENKSLIQSQCKLIQKYLNDPELPYQYSILFEGQGFMPAPPWGSVYLDKENLLMGESTHRYREFLQQQNIVMQTGINEPEDQFGLMLMTLALIIESAEFDAAKQLISQHIMPWAPRYLSLLKEYDGSPFYQALAIIVEQYLSTIVKTLDLTVPHYYLYK
ncbi:TorD/DmsD family molecular chaperone [Orbus mooreae]|uniref:TorD/DmsD family molecular chaperone n=1 Tax=Orbus mooreae TaxID=3074107 RepID=UPI00370DC2FB